MGSVISIFAQISVVDAIVISIFLILNLVVGIYFSKGIKSLREYTIGGRNFSTATIAATIIATWIGGSSFAITSYESYKNGLYFIIPGIADGVSFFIIAYLYAPRMKEFLGNLSIAEAMGDMYGDKVRACTAISGIIPAVGNVSMQFSILTLLLTNFVGISGMYAVFFSSTIVIIYSSFGGVKAVTFTDVIQFFAFGIMIPITAFLICLALDNSAMATLHVLETNPLFDYSDFIDINNPRFLSTLCLFLFFLIPGLDPALFQRISMGKNVKQVMTAFTIAGVMIIFC